MTINRIALAALVTTAAVGGYISVASGEDSTDRSEVAAPAVVKVDPATEFGVFRRSPGTADAMPDNERRVLAAVAGRENVSLADARAVTASAGRPVWAIPGPNKVCVAIPDPVDGHGISCAGGTEAADGRLWVAIVGLPGQKVGDARVAVFVPDGVKAVTAVGRSGEETQLPVTDNVAFGDVADAGAVGFTGADGVVRSTRIGGTTEQMVQAAR